MEQLNGILFIDIETVPIERGYELLTPGMQKEWTKKARLIKGNIDPNTEPATLFSEKAGVYSEFAKVVCICIGSLHKKDGHWTMRLKSLTGDDEKVLLNDFCNLIERFGALHKDFRFCGHNIKEFDIPFICRRMVITGVTLPACMMHYGKKPWEVTHLDTLELWKFGDYKNFTSLSLLAEVLGIPSPKGDIDGSQVAGVYYNDNDLARIGRYCLQDVLTSARVYLRLAGIPHVNPDPIYVDD
ncbi:MAG: 3'-5' exonuclease [Taibaiella sp.]|nr:3'-5' exonuclease [Taibaiella sp.]